VNHRQIGWFGFAANKLTTKIRSRCASGQVRSDPQDYSIWYDRCIGLMKKPPTQSLLIIENIRSLGAEVSEVYTGKILL
jgi:hypothetical protein